MSFDCYCDVFVTPQRNEKAVFEHIIDTNQNSEPWSYDYPYVGLEIDTTEPINPQVEKRNFVSLQFKNWPSKKYFLALSREFPAVTIEVWAYWSAGYNDDSSLHIILKGGEVLIYEDDEEYMDRTSGERPLTQGELERFPVDVEPE